MYWFRKESFSIREMDFILFCLLFVFMMSYQIQFLVPAFASLRLRELLYLYLYVRVAFAYRPKASPQLIAIGVFFVMALLVAFNTYLSYPEFGRGLASKGFLRFVNVALLAPLAAIFLDSIKRIRIVLMLWAGVVVIGAYTVAHQFMGGSMDWLVQNYIAIRANLIRYKSFLGEPNVGGMSGILLMAVCFWGIEKRVLRWLGIGAAYFLVLMSLSKAALFGFLFLCGVMLGVGALDLKNGNTAFLRRLGEGFFVLLLWLGFSFASPALYEYASVHVRSFIGKQHDVPSAAQDLSDRAFLMKYGTGFEGVDPAFFFGHSYGSAGSVALELGVPKAVGPHNSYLEIFIVGGLLMLLAFFTIQFLTFKTFLVSALKQRDLLFRLFLLLFVLLSIFMVGYPNIYEPVTGALFWTLVGVASNIFVRSKMIS